MASLAASTYLRVFGGAPTYSQGWLRGGTTANPLVTVQRSVRSIDDDTARLFLESRHLQKQQTKWVELPSTSVEIIKPVAMDVSPSGQYVVLLKHAGKDGDNPVVEIRSVGAVDNDPVLHAHSTPPIMLSAKTIHGKFIGDTWLGGISWSSCERYVAYVANAKQSDAKTYFDDGSSGESTKFEFKESWGEKYEEVIETVVCVVDRVSGQIVVLPHTSPSSTSSGQPEFMPFSNRLSFTSWKTSPRKLGMIYCYNRPCSIHITQDEIGSSFRRGDSECDIKFTLLTEGLEMARSPRFSACGTQLVFLGSRTGFSTHNGCSELFRIRFSTKDTATSDIAEVIVEETRHSSSTSEFPGLFIDQLPRDCFCKEGSSDCIILSTSWGSVEKIVKVNLETKVLAAIAVVLPASDMGESGEWNNHNNFSLSVLDVQHNKILLSLSSPSSPSRLAVLDLFDSGGAKTPTILSKSTDIPLKISLVKDVSATALSEVPLSMPRELKWKVIKSRVDGVPFEGIVILPPQHSSRSPLIVVPHGGPHSVTHTAFFPAYTFLVLHLGAVILHINYRGSTGFGQDALESLCGNIGTNDVHDCVSLTEICIEEGWVDRERVAVVGGSHGGFLAAHLVGQHPLLFKVAALRNPVFDIPAMVGTTDIPDWCFVEAQGVGSYDHSTVPSVTTDGLCQMKSRSPSLHVDNIKAPCLICLGMKDKRVPASQGILMHNMLRARGTPSTLMTFPDDVHAIDRPASEAEHWCAIANWLQKYL